MNHYMYVHAESDVQYKALDQNVCICILTTSRAKNGFLKMYIYVVEKYYLLIMTLPFGDISLKMREYL